MSLRGALATKHPRSRLLRFARNDKVKRIGLFGGTFNPIHIGHIKMAEAARKKFKLDKVYFIPAGVPPHKSKKGLLPAKLRYKLVKEVVNRLNREVSSKGKGISPFEVLDIEIKQKSKCYTINTVKNLLRNLFLSSYPLTLYFLVGQDEFEKLHTWNKANELAKLVTFIILPRTSNSRSKNQKLKAPPKARPAQPCKARRARFAPKERLVPTKLGGKSPKVKDLRWHMLKIKPIDISSTEIRNFYAS